MNGAESLIRTLLAGGVDTCFSNPGTSEIHTVAALDRIPEVRCVLGLFEGVVTGAADGYARMTEKPACTLLHLGPGLGNGLANLHNASRAQVPIVNLVGQHATDHLHYDTPLTSDIEGIARPYSKWLRTSRSASEIGGDAAEAVVAARTAPGQIATLIVPADVAWNEGGSIASIPSVPRHNQPEVKIVEHAAAMLRSGLRTAILIAGNGLYGKGLVTAGRIAKATGAKLMAPYPITRLQRGAGTAKRRKSPVCPRTSNRAVQGISPADSRGRAQLRSPISLIPERAAYSLRRIARSLLWRAPAKITLARSMRWRRLYRYAGKNRQRKRPKGPPCPAEKSRCRALPRQSVPYSQKT